MRFQAKDREQSKKIVNLLWASVAQGHIKRNTVRKIYIQKPICFGKTIKAFVAGRTGKAEKAVIEANGTVQAVGQVQRVSIKEHLSAYFKPSSNGAMVAVAAFALCAVVTVTMCSLSGEKRRLEQEKAELEIRNTMLSDDVSLLNDTVGAVSTQSQQQQELIESQQEALKQIQDEMKSLEEQYQQNVEEVAEEKDATIQELVDMIENLDIFSGIVSRSDNLASSSSQISAAKDVISSVLGDTPEAAALIEKLDAEQAKLKWYSDHYPDYYPAPGPVVSPFGWRRDPFTAETKFHQGVDISNGTGTPIYASAAGTVTHAQWMSGYGYCIVVDHGNGISTRYAHLSSMIASVGQTVAKGERIALMGATGRATGPHLHFEVIVGGTCVNPMDYIG